MADISPVGTPPNPAAPASSASPARSSVLGAIGDFIKSIPADRSEIAALLALVNDTIVLANTLGAHISPAMQQAALAEVGAVTALAGLYLVHRSSRAA